MPSKTTWITGGANQPSMGAGATVYIQVGAGGNREGTTESWVSAKCQIAGSWSKMTVTTNYNTRTNTTTVRSRKNNAAGGMVISVLTLTTGAFTATTGSDTLAVNDSYNMSVVTGGGGGGSGLYWPGLFGFMFTHASNSITKFMGNPGVLHNDYNLICPSYYPYFGIPNSGPLHSDNFTLKRLGVSVSANTRTNTNTYQVQKDAPTDFSPTAVGPVVVFNAAETGEKVDLTNVHTVTTGETEYAFGVLSTLNGGSGTITARTIYIYFDSTDDDFYIAPSMAAGKNWGTAPVSYYVPISHFWEYASIESKIALPSPIQFTIKEIKVYWRTNELPNDYLVLYLYVNGVIPSGTPSASLAAGQGNTQSSFSGLPISINAGDTLSYRAVSNASSGIPYLEWVYMKCTTYYPPPPVVNIKTVSYINRTVQGIS